MTGFNSISEALDLLVEEPTVRPNWQEILRLAQSSRSGDVAPMRRRMSLRRSGLLAVVCALVGLVAVVVAAAYALGHPIIRFESAPHDSSRTVVNFFGRMTVGVPKGIAVLPRQARQITTVQTNGREYVLLIAPTKDGGFCWVWPGANNGCRLPGQLGVVAQVSGTMVQRSGRQLLTIVAGSFPESRTDRVVLRYADGQTAAIPFVWVTQPISSGFFLYGVPREHQRPNREAAEILLLDAAGKLIDSQPVLGSTPIVRQVTYRLVRHQLSGYAPMLVPKPAQWAKRTQLFEWRAETGAHLGLWVAPARGGGTCYWSNIQTGCMSGASYLPFWPKILRGKRYASLCCTIDPDAARVEVSFQDGNHTILVPKEGYLFWPIPRRHYLPGHRINRLVTYNAQGDKLQVLNVRTDIRALYPCKKPKNYGYGLSMCP